MKSNQVIIVGASARSAGESASRLGNHVMAYDLFADRDLAAVATATQIASDDYPNAIPHRVEDIPAEVPWLYTGGIENHPAVIDSISDQRPLLGNTAEVVRMTTDPHWLAAVAESAGWQVPATVEADASGKFHNDTVFRKPKKHCGGLRAGISALLPESPETYLFQEFLPGPVYGAVFLGDPNGPMNHLLAVTRQFSARDVPGNPLSNDHPFAYLGSYGPLALNREDRLAWESLGRAISEVALENHLAITGIYGIDAIRHETKGWILLELNPRWTASVELWERTHKCNAMEWHLDACLGRLPHALPGASAPAFTAKKQIVYSPSPLQITNNWYDEMLQWTKRVEMTAHDVPRLDEQIESGHPILTLIAHSDELHPTDEWFLESAETTAGPW